MNYKLFMLIGVLTVFASCGGENTNKSAQLTAAVATDNSPYLAGKTIYQKTCTTCHQADGKGLPNAFPPLAGSDYLLKDKFRAIKQVIKGSSSKITVNGADFEGVMPPQGLNDSDVANVLTYVYHSFGNNGFTINLADVKSVRDTINK